MKCIPAAILTVLLTISAVLTSFGATISGSETVSGTGTVSGSEAASGSASSSSAPGPSEAGPLHVEGTGLAGRNGEPVMLRGISTHGLQWYPQYVNADTFRELRNNWNINVIRLALYTDESGWCATDEQGKARLRGVLDRGIRLAAENDLYVILDWHILRDGNPNTRLADAKAFFEEYSSRFAASDHILYEICNEPNGGTTWNEIRQYAEEIIPVIRANDPDSVILIGTPFWSQKIDNALENPLSAYGNLMYTFHFYAATHGQDLRDRLKETVSKGLPVFVSECGLCSADGNGNIDRESAAAWLDLLEQNGISHIFWNLSNKNEASALLSPACTKLSGFSAEDLSESGQLVYAHLTGTGTFPVQNAGNDSEETYLHAGNISPSLHLRSSWPEGNRYAELYDVTVTASERSVNGWEFTLPVPAGSELRDSWGGQFQLNDGMLHIRNKDYNASVRQGESVQNIGFIILLEQH